MSVDVDRGLRIAGGLALASAVAFLVKVALLAAVGTDRAWQDHIAGTSYVVGTLFLLVAVGVAVWASWQRGTASRVAAVLGSLVGVMVIQGVADEVGIATLDQALADVVEFETSMVVSALGGLALWWWTGQRRRHSPDEASASASTA